MKVAIIHYWLVNIRGGERVLEALCRIYPQADIYTHVVDPTILSPTLRAHRIIETRVARLPLARRWYQRYLTFMPKALEDLDLQEYDLVISCESGPAKGVIVRPDALHLCYCHSPMRYLWDMYHQYRKKAGLLARFVIDRSFGWLRVWDVSSAARVDGFAANSRWVAGRILSFWRRESRVINPPVDLEGRQTGPDGGYYLWFGQLVAYKGIAKALEAFEELGLPLVIAGDGEQRDLVKKHLSKTISWKGRVSDAQARELLAGCRALIFPGVEDFGIIPLEAMGHGKPVIALGRGGALETVRHGESGFLYFEDSASGLAQAVRDFEAARAGFDAPTIRRWAEGFGEERFAREILDFVATEGQRKARVFARQEPRS